MFGRRRLAREEYVIMGRNPVWLLNDAVNLLTCFEMEMSGAFGDTDDLVEITKLDVGEFSHGIKGSYSELCFKWNKILHIALWDGDILYANIPRRDEEPLDLPEGAGKTIDDTSSFCIDELLRFLVCSVESGDLELDLKSLQDFLNGKGTAPMRDVRFVKKPISLAELKSAIGSNMATLTHKEAERFKELLNMRIEDYLSGDCRCTSKTAFEEMKKWWSDEDEMKSDVKVGYYSLHQKIKATLRDLEESDPDKIVRRNQAEGYRKEKISDNCPKHRRTILK